MRGAVRLEGPARAAALAELTDLGWRLVEGRDAVEKAWKFKTFSEAWGVMSRVALRAEALEHHPEWRNVYATLEVVLTTHSCDGLSDRDLALARAIERYTLGAEVVAPGGDCACG